MYTESEIKKLNGLYSKIPTQIPEDFLDDAEVELIRDKGLSYYNIRNYLFVPKHHKKAETTIRFQRLMLDFDLGDWLKQIAYNIRYTPDMLIEIGFSFIVKVGIDTGKKDYMYANKNMPAYRQKLTTPEEFHKFAEDIGKLKPSDHLSKTFWQADDQARFRRSGWTPHKIVSCYIWLTK